MTDLPKSWALVPITEILELNNNGKPFQQGWSPQCHPHPADEDRWGVLKTTAIQSGEFWPHENKALPDNLEGRPHIEIRRGDVLMTCAGPRARCGVACLVTETRSKLMMSGKMYRFRPHPNAVASKFLMYFLHVHATQLEIDRMKTGINDSGLNLTHDRFATLRVPVAPFNEQRRIVARIEELFSELNKGVEALTTAREQLKVYRQSVLKHAFAGFETTCPLPELLAQPMSNGYSGKPVSKQTRWRVLSLSATTSGVFSQDHFKYLDEPDLDGRDIWCETGDILVQRGNTKEYVGVPAIYTGKSKEFIFPDLMIRLRANREIISPEYLWYALSTPALRTEMRRKAKGSAGTMPKINQKILAELEIPYCEPKMQQRIVQRLEALASQGVALETEIEVQTAKSAALRRSILQQAFTGQLVAQDPKDEPASVFLERIKETAAGRRNKGAIAEPSAIVVPFPHKIPSIPTTDLHAGIIALAYDHHAKKPRTLNTFGHVKAEKIVHLVEYHLGIDLERTPVKDAAGPNDYRRLLKVEHRANKKNWFGVRRSGNRYVFTKKHCFTHLLATVAQALGEHTARVEALIKVFLPMDTQQAEIFATIYAAWNNLLLTGNASPSDEEIVTEARECWTESKLKIERQKFFNALGWMKKNDLASRGIGRVVEAKAQ